MIPAPGTQRPKNDLATLEHPFFALKAGDTAMREYAHGGYTLTVMPNANAGGMPTVFDKDLLIYCMTKIMERRNRGEETDAEVSFVPRDFLRYCRRNTGGRGYRELEAALARFTSTYVETNIPTRGVKPDLTAPPGSKRRGFTLIQSHVVEGSDRITVTLCPWLFNAALAQEVLTINPDYFDLRKPLERRFYEIARKHCGLKGRWTVSLATLFKKSGAGGTLKLFRSRIRKGGTLILVDYLMDYAPETDRAIFYHRHAGGQAKKLARLSLEPSLPGF